MANGNPRNLELKESYIVDAELKGFACLTIKTYASTLRHFLDYLGPKEVTTITMDDLRGFLAIQKKAGLQLRTLGCKFSAVLSFCEYLEYEGFLKNNPCHAFRRRYLQTVRREGAKAGEQRQLISVEDMRRLVHSITDIRDRTILVLFAKTGMRREELVQTDIENINWTKQSISVKPHPKRTNTTVYFDDETARLLKRWLVIRKSRTGTETGPLFTGERQAKARRIDQDAVNRAVTGAAAAAKLHDPEGELGKRFTPHCCRHWFTTHLRRAGMTREHIAWLRGDAGHETLDVYLRVDPEEARVSYRRHVPQLGVS